MQPSVVPCCVLHRIYADTVSRIHRIRGGHRRARGRATQHFTLKSALQFRHASPVRQCGRDVQPLHASTRYVSMRETCNYCTPPRSTSAWERRTTTARQHAVRQHGRDVQPLHTSTQYVSMGETGNHCTTTILGINSISID